MKTRTYKTVIPYDDTADMDVLRWLTRESFEKKIAGDGLELVEYSEQDVDPATIPPKTQAMFPNHSWREFTATAKLPADIEALINS